MKFLEFSLLMHEMTEIIEEKSFDRKLSFLVETTGEFLLDITHALLTTEFTCFLENVIVFSFFCTIFALYVGLDRARRTMFSLYQAG